MTCPPRWLVPYLCSGRHLHLGCPTPLSKRSVAQPPPGNPPRLHKTSLIPLHFMGWDTSSPPSGVAPTVSSGPGCVGEGSLGLTASSSWFRARKRSRWLEMMESRESTWPSGRVPPAGAEGPGEQETVSWGGRSQSLAGALRLGGSQSRGSSAWGTGRGRTGEEGPWKGGPTHAVGRSARSPHPILCTWTEDPESLGLGPPAPGGARGRRGCWEAASPPPWALASALQEAASLPALGALWLHFHAKASLGSWPLPTSPLQATGRVKGRQGLKGAVCQAEA